MSTLNKLCKEAIYGIKDDEGIYNESILLSALEHIIRDGMSTNEIRKSLIQVALELTTDMEPKWQYAAARMYTYELYDDIRNRRGLKENENPYTKYYEFIEDLTEKGLYGEYILQNYSKEDILELEGEIKPERDFLFNYSGINLS